VVVGRREYPPLVPNALCLRNTYCFDGLDDSGGRCMVNLKDVKKTASAVAKKTRRGVAAVAAKANAAVTARARKRRRTKAGLAAAAVVAGAAAVVAGATMAKARRAKR
jgi:hypothetical protein